MNNKCIYLKQKFNKKLECKYKKKIINIKDCANCPFKEYKMYNILKKQCKTLQNSAKSPVKIKKSSKLAKLERNRTSLFTDDDSKCIFCGSTYKLTWHEIFGGRNRQNSMKYKLCLRMCLECHELNQENRQFNDEWHKKGQAMFEKTYPNLKFEDVFRKNYKN